MNPKLRTALIVLISGVWAINFIMPLFQHNYKPPAEINLAFMGVVGLLTAGYKSEAKPEPQQYQPIPNPVPEPPPPQPTRKRTPAKKTAKKAPVKKAAKKTAKKAVKKQQPRKRSR